jgi:tRNA(Ile)-lysidine synthetase-like protein
MNLSIDPGSYIVAVSGGVDSMALLHLVSGVPEVRLVVAHYDHGIRTDSGTDRLLVASVAERYGLPFVYEAGNLGKGASEATARAYRYAFLDRVRSEYQADAVRTAHHQDDVLETAIINLLRGTGRKGLSALSSTPIRTRPLLRLSKAAIEQYARNAGLCWHEDSTNADERYLRNYVRLRLLPRFSPVQRAAFLRLIESGRIQNEAIEEALLSLIRSQPGAPQLARRWFTGLPHIVAKEVLATWFRQDVPIAFTEQTLERVVVMAKTHPPGTIINIASKVSMIIQKDVLALVVYER